jgi:hypothetical protein
MLERRLIAFPEAQDKASYRLRRALWKGLEQTLCNCSVSQAQCRFRVKRVGHGPGRAAFHVRFVLKATKLLRRREMQRWANSNPRRSLDSRSGTLFDVKLRDKSLLAGLL